MADTTPSKDLIAAIMSSRDAYFAYRPHLRRTEAEDRLFAEAFVLGADSVLDHAAQPPNAALADGWMPIEKAPRGANGYAWMHLAWGPDEEKSTGSGMRWGDKFFAVATFYALWQDQRYVLRVIEVQPTHWREEIAPPTLNANG